MDGWMAGWRQDIPTSGTTSNQPEDLEELGKFWLSLGLELARDMGASPKLGVPFWGPHNKDYSI